MANMFPRTDVAGVSVPRMIIGTNWLLGFSHTGAAADKLIMTKHSTSNAMSEVLETFLASGIDAVLGPISMSPILIDAIKETEDKTGKKLIIIDTPRLNVDDNAAARKEAEKTFAESRKIGTTFCLPIHAAIEQLVNKNKQTIDRLPDYLKMIRDNGMIPGLSAHMPEIIVYSDLNGYDVETYIQIYNCLGFMMQIEVEYVHKIIWGAKKPVMTIKPMAAGRTTPFVGLNFVWHTIRPCDMVTVGCLTPEEAAEDIEISFAALEGRSPNIAGRNSPVKTSIMK